MTNLSLINNDQTMSSVEIAELTGKEHKNVLADIRKMLVEIQSPEKAGDYKDSMGRTQPCLLLDKDETRFIRGSRFTTSPNLGDIHYLIPPETGVFRFVTPRRFCWWLGVRRHRIGDNVLKFKGRSPPPKTYSLSVLLITSWATGRLISKLIPPCRF